MSEALGSLSIQRSAALSIDRLTTKGCHSLDIAGAALGWKESSLLSMHLKELFGDFYTLSGSVNVTCERTPIVQPQELTGTARALWQILVEDGWSRERFVSALGGFVRRKHYGKDSWTPGDFLACSPETDLHDHKWYLEQSENDRASRIETYLAPGDTVLLYRLIGTGVPLPAEFHKVWPKEAQ